MSGVVLGGVVEVVGSNLARGKIFTASIGSVDSLYPSVYIYIYIYIYTCHHSTEAVSEPTHHQEKRDPTSRTLTGIGQVRTETDKGMNNLIIDYQTRTRTIF